VAEGPGASAFVALGSNLGDRLRHLEQGLALLEQAGCRLLRLSSVWVTKPEEFLDQPEFLNQVAELRTPHTPLELLRECLAIEARLGRERQVPKGPRPLDLDLLLFGDLVLDHQELQLPHPRLSQRRFVLEPLVEIAPDRVIPGLGQTARQLLGSLLIA